MKMRVVRVSRSDDSTFGALVRVDGVAIAATLELPWRNNERNRSCIPPGRYVCRRFYSQRFELWTFEITGVPNRSKCLFHPANLAFQLEGCIALGHGFDPATVRGVTDDGIVKSVKEFTEFMKLMEGVDEFPLEVLDPTPW